MGYNLTGNKLVIFNSLKIINMVDINLTPTNKQYISFLVIVIFECVSSFLFYWLRNLFLSGFL